MCAICRTHDTYVTHVPWHFTRARMIPCSSRVKCCARDVPCVFHGILHVKVHVHMLQETWSTQTRDVNLEYLCRVSLCVHACKSEVINERYCIVRKTDKNLLKDNGGPIDITKTWAKSLLSRLGYVKWKASSTAKVEPSNYEQLIEQYLLDIKAVVEMEDIPADLILNWDHMGINIIPGCYWTMEEKDAKRVDCLGLDDKRQITVVIRATLSGIFCLSKLFIKVKHLHVYLGTPFLQTGM